MNADYKRHAYARTILFELAHYLRERFIQAEEPARDTMICEEVLYADREVPQEDLHAMLNRLLRMQEQERLAMAEFEMLRRPQLPQAPAEPPPQGETHESKSTQKNRIKGAG